jgi:fibronectin-binding autotransporter adhesin
LGAAEGSGVLEYTGSGDTTDRKFTIGATGSAANANGATINNNGSGALAFTNATFNATIASVSATRLLTLGGSYSGGTNTIKGVIQDNATGTGGLVALTKAADASIWALTGTSTYSGGTTMAPLRAPLA